MNNFKQIEKEYPIITTWRAYNFGKSLEIFLNKFNKKVGKQNGRK